MIPVCHLKFLSFNFCSAAVRLSNVSGNTFFNENVSFLLFKKILNIFQRVFNFEYTKD